LSGTPAGQGAPPLLHQDFERDPCWSTAGQRSCGLPRMRMYLSPRCQVSPASAATGATRGPGPRLSLSLASESPQRRRQLALEERDELGLLWPNLGQDDVVVAGLDILADGLQMCLH